MCGAEIQMPRHLFIPDMLDLPLGIGAIKTLAARYDATFETTAIRYAQMNRGICAIVVVEPTANYQARTTSGLRLAEPAHPPFQKFAHSSPCQRCRPISAQGEILCQSPPFPHLHPPRHRHCGRKSYL